MALVAVIGIMVLGLIVTSALLGAVNGGFGYSSMTRASVQSEASSEAGVSVARAAVTGGTCAATNGHFVSAVGAVPKYDVQVWYLSGTSTWVQGCPPSSSTTIKIVSAGTAQASGVNGASGGDKTNTTVVLTAPAGTATIVSSGQAVYSYGSVTATGAGTVTEVNNTSASVYVANGSLSCDGGAGIAGDVVVPHGDVSITGGCKVGGSIYTTGKLTLSGGTPIGGNIVAASANFSGSGPINGSVWLTGTASSTISSFAIGGSVYTAGPLQISSGSVAGNIIAVGTLTTTAAVTGDVVSGATLNVNNGGSVGGSAYGTGATTIASPVTKNVVSGSTLTISGGSVGKSAWASGATTMSAPVGGDIVSGGTLGINGGSLSGSAYAAGTVSDALALSGSIVTSAGDVTFSGGAKVGGGVWDPAGTVTTAWGQDITGSAVVKNLVLNGGQIPGKAYVSSNVTLNQQANFQIYAKTKSGSGTASPAVITGWNGTSPAPPTAPTAPSRPTAPAAVATPAIPSVAPWVDITFVPSNWAGFTVLTVSGTSCTTKDIYPLIASLGATKGVIDARGCSSVDLSSGYNYGENNQYYQTNDIPVQNDLVILTKKFAMSNGSFTATASHQLWFIQEDTTPDQQPTCNNQSFSFGGGGLSISSNLQLMIYTPCAVTLTSSQSISGQIYSAGTTLSGGGKIAFVPVGIPGWDLDTGTTSVPSDANRTWTASSFTNKSG